MTVHELGLLQTLYASEFVVRTIEIVSGKNDTQFCANKILRKNKIIRPWQETENKAEVCRHFPDVNAR